MTYVLITGAGGTIGTVLREGLQNSFAIRGVDRSRGPGVDSVHDLSRQRGIRRAFEGADVVVDLAGDAQVSTLWERVRRNNVPATLNVLEAARTAGVRRVVFASSNHVVGMYERDEPYASVVAGRYDGLDPADLPRLSSDVPIRPDSPYAVGKALGEAAGRYYAEAGDLSVVCMRIGTVNRANLPIEARHFSTLLTHRDLVHLVERCVSAPADLRFAVVYGVSANTWRIWDIEEARVLVGFEPRDNAEALRR